MNLSKNFYNKKVLITGHTGFKGFWLSLWLKKLGANIYGISLNQHNNKLNEINNFYKDLNNYYFNISSLNKTKEIISKIKPDFVFHLAAQPIVAESYKNPFDTWMTNVIGTQSLLESLKNLKKKSICVFITSDKCYENNEWIWGYKEDDRLGGADPYSSSKASCELLIKSYYKSFFSKFDNLKIATARAGNVIGGNDWSQYRLIPDVIKSWSKNKVVNIRNPKSTRPWQHVLEPINGYLILASKLNTKKSIDGESYNFGPSSIENHTVEYIIKKCSKLWNNKKWKISANTIDETGLLKLNSDKSFNHLNWKSVLTVDQTLKLTMDWYKEYFKNSNNIINFSNQQIDYYEKIKFNDKYKKN